MTQPTWQVSPTTSLGKWSVALIVAMPLLFFIVAPLARPLYEGVPPAGTIPADLAARPVLALTMLAGIACGIASFITGLLAVARQRERSPMVYVAIATGGLLLFFVAVEAWPGG